jgi:GNAT superfamily N-acetyltransferase
VPDSIRFQPGIDPKFCLEGVRPITLHGTLTPEPDTIMAQFKTVYRENLPSPADYHQLFETTGWNQSYRADADELYRAISTSWYTLSAYRNDKLVGFGRVISDGILYALICDLIVRPSCQGQGIGSALLKKLIARCRRQSVRVIWLFSATGKSAFYKNFGFSERPADAPGMQMLATGD